MGKNIWAKSLENPETWLILEKAQSRDSWRLSGRSLPLFPHSLFQCEGTMLERTSRSSTKRSRSSLLHYDFSRPTKAGFLFLNAQKEAIQGSDSRWSVWADASLWMNPRQWNDLRGSGLGHESCFEFGGGLTPGTPWIKVSGKVALSPPPSPKSERGSQKDKHMKGRPQERATQLIIPFSKHDEPFRSLRPLLPMLLNIMPLFGYTCRGDQMSANYSLRAKYGPLPVVVNKVLLTHSHGYSLTYGLRLFSCHNRRFSSCDVDHMVCQTWKNIYYLAFCRKTLPPVVYIRIEILLFHLMVSCK